MTDHEIVARCARALGLRIADDPVSVDHAAWVYVERELSWKSSGVRVFDPLTSRADANEVQERLRISVIAPRKHSPHWIAYGQDPDDRAEARDASLLRAIATCGARIERDRESNGTRTEG